MAEEAGAFFAADHFEDATEVNFETQAQFERFAALVRAEVLEEAAKEVESVDGQLLFDAPEVVRANVTSAIRALVKEK